MADTTAIGIRLLVGVQVWKMEDVCSHATAKDQSHMETLEPKKTLSICKKGEEGLVGSGRWN